MLQIVGNYWGKEKKYEMVAGKSIDWPGPNAPKDIPPCGFDGSKCKDGPLTRLPFSSLSLMYLYIFEVESKK